MKPEEKIEIILSDWLIKYGKRIEEIYFNRENELGWNKFQTTGVNKKPDFLIKLNGDYGIEYCAVEIKDNSKSAKVFDSTKILSLYYKNYINKKTKYLINNKEIKINHFLIATQDSPNGHLFKKEKEGMVIDNIQDTDNDQWRKTLAKYMLEPQFEYSTTSTFQRNLFSSFRQFRKEKNLKSGSYPSLGILTSRIYENGITQKEPHMFIMFKSNKKWGCRFWQI